MTDEPTPQQAGADYDRWVGYLCRHVVCLTLRVRQYDASGGAVGEERLVPLTGFVLSLGDLWFLVTAGHALKEVDGHIEAGRLRLIGAAICDNFGVDAVSPIPTIFDYANEPRWYVDRQDLGLDFAVLHLRPFYRKGLEQNRVRPLARSSWVSMSAADFDHYTVLGFPDEFNTLSVPTQAGFGPALMARVRPTALPVERTGVPHRELPDPAVWFIGRVDRSVLGVRSVVGMSGGPIFALRGWEGGTNYGLIAIQSWWDGTETIYGCPIEVVVGLLREVLAEAITDLAAIDPV